MQVKAISACPEPATQATGEDVSVVFERVFAENYDRLRGHLWWRVRDWHLADDLAQATFVRLWITLGRGFVVEDPANAYPLIWTMAKYELSKHWAAAKIREQLAGDEEVFAATLADPGSLAAFDMVDARACAGQIIAGLPQDYRRVLSLHLLEDLAIPQVAAQTGLDPATVRATVAEGLRRLRAGLGAHEDQIRQASQRRREYARQVYQKAVEAGRPLTMRALAHRFGQPDHWAYEVVRTEGGIPRPIPARERARRDLRAEILAGTYPPGTRMPPARVLAPRWHADHGIVLWAYRALAAEGLLVRGPDRTDGFNVTTARLSQPAAETLPDHTAPRPATAVNQTRARITADLDAGTYPPGTALPPSRILAERLGVSWSTVVRAYKELAAQGRLTRSGRIFLVASGPGTAPGPVTTRPAVALAQAQIAADLDAGLYPPGTPLLAVSL
jgi:RNA polymerase sigma factor (sigma-70 family)